MHPTLLRCASHTHTNSALTPHQPPPPPPAPTTHTPHTLIHHRPPPPHPSAWRNPFRLQVLSCCSNLMVWGEADVCRGIGAPGALPGVGHSSSATPVAVRILVRVAQKLYVACRVVADVACRVIAYVAYRVVECSCSAATPPACALHHAELGNTVRGTWMRAG